MDSNHRRRKPADLQSAPVGRLGIPPKIAENGDDQTGASDLGAGEPSAKTDHFREDPPASQQKKGLPHAGRSKPRPAASNCDRPGHATRAYPNETGFATRCAHPLTNQDAICSEFAICDAILGNDFRHRWHGGC